MSKRGALNLSIQAIVILVMAMLMLGLGIAFISNFFSDAGTKVASAFEVANFGLSPDADNPIVIKQGNTVIVKSGKDKQLDVGVYNREQTEIEVTIELEECVNSELNPITPAKLTTMAQKITPGEAKGFRVFAYAKDDSAANIPPGNYICKLKATGKIGGTEAYSIDSQITFQVTS